MYYRSRGFTLIELLVVIAIIGVLSVVVLNSFNSARKKASVAFVKSSLRQIRSQAELYYDSNGNYGTPQSFGTFLANTTTICNNTCFMDDPIILASLKTFDPHTGPYNHLNHPDQQHYMSYVISTDMQRWSIAVSMVTGPRTYCIDSSGASKETTGDQFAAMFGNDGQCK